MTLLGPIVLVSLAGASLDEPAAYPDCSVEIGALAEQPAVPRAEAAFASGRPYFLGINSFTVDFPGLDYGTYYEMIGKVGDRVLAGTEDAVANEGCYRYQAKAYAFAEQFNRRMVELVRQHRLRAARGWTAKSQRLVVPSSPLSARLERSRETFGPKVVPSSLDHARDEQRF